MLWELIKGGGVALKEYIALHFITCLVPAFFIAGAIVYSVRLLGIDLGISRAIGAIIFSIVIGSDYGYFYRNVIRSNCRIGYQESGCILKNLR